MNCDKHHGGDYFSAVIVRIQVCVRGDLGCFPSTISRRCFCRYVLAHVSLRGWEISWIATWQWCRSMFHQSSSRDRFALGCWGSKNLMYCCELLIYSYSILFCDCFSTQPALCNLLGTSYCGCTSIEALRSTTVLRPHGYVAFPQGGLRWEHWHSTYSRIHNPISFANWLFTTLSVSLI